MEQREATRGNMRQQGARQRPFFFFAEAPFNCTSNKRVDKMVAANPQYSLNAVHRERLRSHLQRTMLESEASAVLIGLGDVFGPSFEEQQPDLAVVYCGAWLRWNERLC